eukprot:9382925-Prorocentrum_lima.AAC.1
MHRYVHTDVKKNRCADIHTGQMLLVTDKIVDMNFDDINYVYDNCDGGNDEHIVCGIPAGTSLFGAGTSLFGAGTSMPSSTYSP